MVVILCTRCPGMPRTAIPPGPKTHVLLSYPLLWVHVPTCCARSQLLWVHWWGGLAPSTVGREVLLWPWLTLSVACYET